MESKQPASNIIRMATLSDAAALLDIYDYYILHTPITFDLESPGLDAFTSRMQNVMAKFPWLVCECEGKVVGYCYAAPFKERRAYDWSVEASVYVEHGRTGRGIGRMLYAHLLKMLKVQGVVNVIGGITLPNQESIELHEKLGFKKVAQFKDAGFKMGQWWDVAYWQLQLERPFNPEPVGNVPKNLLTQ